MSFSFFVLPFFVRIPYYYIRLPISFSMLLIYEIQALFLCIIKKAFKYPFGHLKAFDSLEDMASASVEKLISLGIPKKIAEELLIKLNTKE